MLAAALLLASCDQQTPPTAYQPDRGEAVSPRMERVHTGSAAGYVPEAELLPGIDLEARIAAAASAPALSKKGPPSGRLYKQVLVRPNGGTPGANGAPVVDNFADAVARIQSGGKIRVFDGVYEIDESVEILKPLTIEAMPNASPIIRDLTGASGAPDAFGVFSVQDGTVIFRGLSFEKVEGQFTIAAHDGSNVLVTESSFDVSTGTTGGVFAWQGSNVTVEKSSFAGGIVGAFAVEDGTALTVRSSTFSNTGLAPVQYQSGAGGLIEDIEASDCGAGCVRVFHAGTVDVRDSRFETPLTGIAGSNPEAWHVLIYGLGASGTIAGNEFDGCGYHTCIWSWLSTLDIDSNTFSSAVPKQNAGQGLPIENFPVVIRFENEDLGGRIANNSIDGCSEQGCIAFTLGSSGEIVNNTIVADPDGDSFFGVETWTFDGGPENNVTISGNEIRNVVSGVGLTRAVGSVTDNTISDVPVGIAANGSSVSIEGNQIDALDSGIILAQGSSADVVNNTVDPCGIHNCISVESLGSGETVTIHGNTFRSTFERRTFIGILSQWSAGSGDIEITENVIEGAAPPSDPNSLETYPLEIAYQAQSWYPHESGLGLPHGPEQDFSGNVVRNTAVGVRAHHGGVAAGRDNTFETMHGEVFGASDQGINRVQFSDVSVNVFPLDTDNTPGSVLDVTCTWWGDPAGPQNVPPHVATSAYTPWATSPVAGTSAMGCSGGI